MTAVRKLLAIFLLSHSALLAGHCDPDALKCPACRDCTKCGACAKAGKSCSVMRDQSGAQQTARDAKRAKANL